MVHLVIILTASGASVNFCVQSVVNCSIKFVTINVLPYNSLIKYRNTLNEIEIFAIRKYIWPIYLTSNHRVSSGGWNRFQEGGILENRCCFQMVSAKGCPGGAQGRRGRRVKEEGKR